jgi:hypothetical protein
MPYKFLAFDYSYQLTLQVINYSSNTNTFFVELVYY